MVILAKSGHVWFMKLLLIVAVPKAGARGGTIVLSGLVILLLELETLQGPDVVSPQNTSEMKVLQFLFSQWGD